MRRAICLLWLATLAPACGRSRFSYDVKAEGALINWGKYPVRQPDRAEVHEYLAACRDVVTEQLHADAAPLIKGVEIYFLPAAEGVCGYPATTDIAGCLDGKRAFVEYAPTLDQTALCHEITHYALISAGRSSDPQHKQLEIWNAVNNPRRK